MPEEKKISVLVVDDHPLTRIGVCATINAQPDMFVIAEADSAEKAIEAFQQFAPKIILMDLNLPQMSGVDAIRVIRKRPSSTRIIVLTTYEGDEDIYQALKAGAQGYLIKGMSHEVLLEAIRNVNAGEEFLPPPVAHALHGRTPEATLRPREKEVLQKIVAGKSNKEIASELGISEGTVKCHVSVILLRLGVTDRTQAVIVALQRGVAHLQNP
jgi:DNA-binding NarL/FixJ family response regulator